MLAVFRVTISEIILLLVIDKQNTYDSTANTLRMFVIRSLIHEVKIVFIKQ